MRYLKAVVPMNTSIPEAARRVVRELVEEGRERDAEEYNDAAGWAIEVLINASLVKQDGIQPGAGFCFLRTPEGDACVKDAPRAREGFKRGRDTMRQASQQQAFCERRYEYYLAG